MGLAGFCFVGTAMRVAVFIDRMNIYKAARDAFGLQNEASNAPSRSLSSRQGSSCCGWKGS